jgi:hypothetical protein
MDIGYTWEKLYVAVGALAAGEGTLRDRLDSAAVSALIRLEPADLPTADTQERFAILMQDLSPGGLIREALASWADEDIRRFAMEVVAIYDAVARRFPPE